jgi:hypothetical protein
LRPDAYLARGLFALATLDAGTSDAANALTEAQKVLKDLGADESALARRIRQTLSKSDPVSDSPPSDLDYLLEQARAIIAASPQS